MKKQSNSNLTFKKQFGTTISKGTEGITLVALAITIIIIIILAAVAINFILGENGLITKAQQAKLEQEIATARETLTMILGDAFAEKKINPAYDQNEFLDKFIEAREPNVYLDKDEIGLDGHIFGLDRSVPELGEYQGELTGPRIKEIKVLEETTNSASIEVITVNAEGATYTYSYKNEDEGENQWKKVETDNKSNTCTINGLTQGEIYNIRVIVTTNEGSTSGEINVYLGEIPEGTITFTPAEWVGDGTATTTINTSEEGYTLQYQVVGGEGAIVDTAWQIATSGQTIEGLHHNETVYGRLWDGINESKDYGSVTIKDDENPIVNVTSGGITTNSITVNATVTDGQSGMKEDTRYTYSIKQSGQGEESYTTPSGANNLPTNTYTFTGLTQGTSYDVKVEVNGDKAGNIGIGTASNLSTGTVGGAEGGLTQGNIIASSPTWSNGQASITLTTNTGLQIQYQVGSTTGNWTTIQSGGQVTGINHNDTVYARLWDGNNAGSEASVTIKDTIPPTTPIINTNGYISDTWTRDNITLSFDSQDNELGIWKYQWTPDSNYAIYDATNPYVWSENTRTGFFVRAVDHAGNVSAWSNPVIISKDSLAPNSFDISIDNITTDGFTIHANTTDAGPSGINRYDYIVNGEMKYSGANTSYTVTGLQSGVNYEVYVNCYDNSGNMTRSNNTLNQQIKGNWSPWIDKSSASVTLRNPSSDADPTILNIASSSEEFVRAGVLYSGYVPAGTSIRVEYMYVRSNSSFYLDFLFNETNMESLSYSRNNTRRTYTTTTTEDLNSIIFGLNKSNSISTSIYGTLYIYGIYMNDQKVL